jgi:hypothetical protein
LSNRVLGVLVVALILCEASLASGKRLGFSSPGREIYDADEKFDEVADQNRRKFVIEASVGNGPEGNLGIGLGYLLNIPQGLELYAAFGTRAGPVLHTTGTLRYFLPFLAYKGYIGSGYLFQQHPRLKMWSHSAFGEAGYKWIIRHTFHVTASVGLQRFLARNIRDGSILKGPDVDPAFLDRELDAVGDYRVLFSLRFSRAF